MTEEEVVKEETENAAATDNVELEKKENGDVTKRASLGDMIKEENETNQASETLKETPETVKETPETVKETSETVKETSETVKETSEPVKETPETEKETPETEKETPVTEKSRDVEVVPPPLEDKKAEEEKSPTPVVEAEKNGHAEEVIAKEETAETDGKMEEKSKDEAVSKPASKNIMSKVKNSLVKAKKAIIGKSPSSKTISTDASKGEL
uniref:Deduced protein with a coiled-coil domain n=1 Tax=Salicornia europaea TaxID=206448 RepID=A0A0P0UX26_SALEU|nr:deduced protein with a coiled-coil domain [Salicornia europaea]